MWPERSLGREEAGCSWASRPSSPEESFSLPHPHPLTGPSQQLQEMVIIDAHFAYKESEAQRIQRGKGFRSAAYTHAWQVLGHEFYAWYQNIKGFRDLAGRGAAGFAVGLPEPQNLQVLQGSQPCPVIPRGGWHGTQGHQKGSCCLWILDWEQCRSRSRSWPGWLRHLGRAWGEERQQAGGFYRPRCRGMKNRPWRHGELGSRGKGETRQCAGITGSCPGVPAQARALPVGLHLACFSHSSVSFSPIHSLTHSFSFQATIQFSVQPVTGAKVD